MQWGEQEGIGLLSRALFPATGDPELRSWHLVQKVGRGCLWERGAWQSAASGRSHTYLD